MKNRWMVLVCVLAMLAAGAACAEDSLTGEEMQQVEHALYALGYHDGQCDALLDEHTRMALTGFQQANGLEQTGEPDEQTLEMLFGGEAITRHEYLVQLAAEYAEQPILQVGSSGDSVLRLQRKLQELGYFSGSCDGVFGDATMAAVKRFQLANGLEQTGVADHSTHIRLSEGEPLSWDSFVKSAAASLGDSGVRVRMLQRTLRQMGYYDGECSGMFGDLTQAAVILFQQQNELEQTGDADEETCRRLYSGSAHALRMPGTLYRGCDDPTVADLQRELAGLGYFEHSMTGFYTETTETAVRLFQMANGLPATGEADPETRERLSGGAAAPMDSVLEVFRSQVRIQDEAARAVIGSLALQARGQAFAADDEDLYEGFVFVQHICVSAGIPVVSPEDVVELINDPVEDYSQLAPGDILALRMADEEGDRVMLAISAGEGRIIYATQDSGWVLESHLSELPGGELYRWSITGAQEPPQGE